jgi:hypothetical protein
MPRFSIEATSPTAGYTVKRHAMSDGSNAIFKNATEAEQAAAIWVSTLNEAKFSDADDWTTVVAKS